MNIREGGSKPEQEGEREQETGAEGGAGKAERKQRMAKKEVGDIAECEKKGI